MLEVIIGILVKLLVEYLVDLIKKWFNGGSFAGSTGGNGIPTVSYLSSGQNEFVSKVRWRFWLGPKRVALAESAYRLAMERHEDNLTSGATVFLVSKQDAAGLANQITENLAADLREVHAAL